MKILEGLKYTRTHQWLREEDGGAAIGITDYAQSQLQGVIFVNLPEVGDELRAGEPFGDVESTKVVADVHSPVSGRVTEVNEVAMDEPERLNEDPYGVWLIKAGEIGETVELMSAEEYRAYLDSLPS